MKENKEIGVKENKNKEGEIRNSENKTKPKIKIK
jgi:hypothetical protein